MQLKPVRTRILGLQGHGATALQLKAQRMQEFIALTQDAGSRLGLPVGNEEAA
jgi:hypothetical protein